MLFHTISDVPGYKYHTVDPWKSWEADIISSADASLSRTFSGNLGVNDQVDLRGALARDLGLAYQITKKSSYALKAREALLYMNTGATGTGDYAKSNQARALAAYSLAYDWIQPTLDPATDIRIRDKLAVLANTVYEDLNDHGKALTDVSFSQQGQTYPSMGVASAALYGYTNPNKLLLNSTPAQWHQAGKEYLFENDKLHSFGKSLFSWGFDQASGKSMNGAYKSYVLDDLALWYQVSYHAYGENLLDIYPAAKKAFTAETWDSLPNEYSDNYVTDGNTKWIYHKAIVSLLPTAEKSVVLNHIYRAESASLLPYSSTMGGGTQGSIPSAVFYAVYGNYGSLARTFPAATSRLDPGAIIQLFRGSWSNDADWLSLVTFNKNTRSNRDMQHHDQLSFEYYSRGDLLLSDGGEDRVILDRFFGTGAPSHNTIAIENPRSPFPASPYTGSSALGIYKGDAGGLDAIPMVDTVIKTPWIQAVQAKVTIRKLSSDTVLYASRALTSPIRYTRAVLYPDSDYFIVVDRMEGSETWTYNNIFRPSSLVFTKTADANKDGIFTASEVGHVNGALTIGTTPYSWQALTYKKPTQSGITTSTISWATTNPYGKAVKLAVVSAPASPVVVTKYVGRIGGSGSENEVYNPVIYLKNPPAKSLYRVTALLSRYGTETAKTATEIPVTGIGHALKVKSGLSADFIYTGKGVSSFAGFTTNADTVYIRKTGTNMEFTLINGSYLKRFNSTIVSLDRRVSHLTVKEQPDTVKFNLKSDTGVIITLKNTMATKVFRNSVPYYNWVMDEGSKTLKISIPG